jgi:hypothetical protein
LKTHEINAETRPGPIGLTDHTETQHFRYQTHHLSFTKAKAKKKQQPTLIPLSIRSLLFLSVSLSILQNPNFLGNQTRTHDVKRLTGLH